MPGAVVRVSGAAEGSRLRAMAMSWAVLCALGIALGAAAGDGESTRDPVHTRPGPCSPRGPQTASPPPRVPPAGVQRPLFLACSLR